MFLFFLKKMTYVPDLLKTIKLGKLIYDGKNGIKIYDLDKKQYPGNKYYFAKVRIVDRYIKSDTELRKKFDILKRHVKDKLFLKILYWSFDEKSVIEIVADQGVYDDFEKASEMKPSHIAGDLCGFLHWCQKAGVFFDCHVDRLSHYDETFMPLDSQSVIEKKDLKNKDQYKVIPFLEICRSIVRLPASITRKSIAAKFVKSWLKKKKKLTMLKVFNQFTKIYN